MTKQVLSAILATLVLALALATGCDRFEPAPTPAIAGIEAGILYDSKAPFVLDFGQPIDVATLDFKVASLDTNIEGELGDEDGDPDTELKVLIGHSPLDGDRGGRLEVEGDGARVRFIADAALPVGPKLVLIVEPGLTGTGGRVRTNRTKIPFSYAVRCVAGKKATQLKSGVYFALLEVEQPLGVQIQVFAVLDVDPATGAFIGQFTNADRNPAQQCPTPCGAADVCRLLPSPQCVPPSTRAGTTAEWPDWIVNATPPTGYTFPVTGCAVDDGTGAGVVTAPATMVVQSPAVTVQGLAMTAFFGPDDASGLARGTGSLTAEAVLLNENRIGAGKGTMTAALVPAEKVPSGLPQPDKALAAGDAGAAAAGDGGR